MIRFHCPQCSRLLEVDDAYAGSAGVCPTCQKPLDVPAVPPPVPAQSDARVALAAVVAAPLAAARGKIHFSGWAIAALVCGLMGCTLVTAVLAIIFGLQGIRAVNRSQGQVKGVGLAITGMVLGLLALLLIPFVVYPAIMEAAHRTTCTANLHGIGQAIKVYCYSNKGQYPTVFRYVQRDGTPVVNTWGENWAPSRVQIADRGTEADVALRDHPPFTCNVSALWLLVCLDMARPEQFCCPSSGREYDESRDFTRWWSFDRIDHLSYSYQNQAGANTNETADSRLIIVADVNPQRGDLEPSKKQPGVANRWEMNSPNHDFKGQNCLYLDGHVEFEITPNCGIRGNNIWLASKTLLDARPSEAQCMEIDTSYADKASVAGSKDDSFLVP